MKTTGRPGHALSTALALGAALLVLAGCAGVRSLVSEADIRPMGSGLMAILSGDHPAGTYWLETTQGKAVARGVVGSPRPGGAIQGRATMPMSVDLRLHPEARGCLRLRRPDGKLVAIGASGQTEFRLPAFEAAHIQMVELPELQLAERDHQRHLRTVAATRQWMAGAPPELTPNQTCRVPLPSYGACGSEHTARQAARASCFEANVACGAAAVGADIVARWTDTKQGAASLLPHLTSGACTIAYDLQRGDNINWWSLFRGLVIDVTAESLYRSLVNENPSVSEKVALAGMVGALHYELCLSDAVDQCRQQASRQQRFAQAQYRGCVDRMGQYRRAEYLLERYGAPADIQKVQRARQARLQELNARGLFQSVPLVQQVLSCS